MKFVISENATRVITGLAVLGLVISVIVHLESIFLKGAYQIIYGVFLFNIGIALFVLPPLYEIFRSRELYNNFISNLTEQDFPKLTMLIFKIAMFYFSILLIIELINLYYGKTDDYTNRLFWSFGNVVIFLGIIIYNQTIQNVRRSCT